MRRRERERRARLFSALMVCFCAGALTDWWAREKGAENAAARAQYGTARPVAMASSIAPSVSPPSVKAGAKSPEAPAATKGTIDPERRIRFPIDGVDPEAFEGQFAERRGDRAHEAIDILAPRNTPVHAVADGTIAKLFFSQAGGITIYQFDADGRLCFYYAHLERYAEGLHEGQRVSRGEVIGHVGTSGNAPPETPHLHFAVFKLDADRRWWRGQPLDPYLLFRDD